MNTASRGQRAEGGGQLPGIGLVGACLQAISSASARVQNRLQAGSHTCPQSVIRPLSSVLCLLVLILCATSARAAEPAAKEDPVIVPRSTVPGETAAAGRTGGASPVLLVVAIGAAAAGGWLLWRQRRAPGGLTGRDARKLAVVESRGLGNRQYLVVADYDGQKFLLGVCPGRIEMLSKLDGRAGEGETGA